MLLKRSTLPLLLVLCAALIPLPVSAAPVEAAAALPDLATFKASLATHDARALRGVYADGLFALEVVPQPPSQPGFVSSAEGTVTQFAMASQFDVVGLLAHDFLSGGEFAELATGQHVDLIYGDGHTLAYRVTKIYRLQALTPNSITSDFLDLETHKRLSAEAVFAMVYQGAHHVTFQTCIPAAGDPAWGRLFVIAEPEPGTG